MRILGIKSSILPPRSDGCSTTPTKEKRWVSSDADVLRRNLPGSIQCRTCSRRTRELSAREARRNASLCATVDPSRMKITVILCTYNRCRLFVAVLDTIGTAGIDREVPNVVLAVARRSVLVMANKRESILLRRRSSFIHW